MSDKPVVAPDKTPQQQRSEKEKRDRNSTTPIEGRPGYRRNNRTGEMLDPGQSDDGTRLRWTD